MADKVKIGVVGLGNMGSGHLNYLKDMDNAELVGVCDVVKEKADRFAERYNVPAYYTHEDMLDKSGLEAILIAVPHYDHVPIAVAAFERNKHVLCEKPITVHVNGAKKMLAAYEAAKAKNSKLVFGIMFQERTIPTYIKMREIIKSGELGRLTRVTWVNTAWFRSQAYYDSGGWRATWSGEGGGILTNQCPHNLDTYHWFFGLPEKIYGFAHIGKYHNIEVEDEVTAYMEHSDGMISHFIVTTAESPGTNRFEIVGENGTLVSHRGLSLVKNKMSMLKWSNETKEGFKGVDSEKVDVQVDGSTPQGHRAVTDKFLNSIITGEIDLIAHGEEGLNPVMIANAIMLSSFEDRGVKLPLDGDPYEKKLRELIQGSKFVKGSGQGGTGGFENSFGKA